MAELSAYDGITLRYGGNTVVLRPSLRAASRLERLHDGFPALLKKVEEFDTRTIAAIVTLSAEDRQAAQELFLYAGKWPLAPFIQATQAPIFKLINALLPEPAEDDKTPAQPTGTPMPWAEVYKELFGFATGWLGWSPETAWNATPQEISDAFTAHVTKLKAIHGSPEDDADDTASADAYTNERLKQIVEQGHDPAFDRAGLHALKSKAGV